jgi:hypothetical protein
MGQYGRGKHTASFLALLVLVYASTELIPILRGAREFGTCQYVVENTNKQLALYMFLHNTFPANFKELVG